MKKATILAILMIVVLSATTISCALPTPYAKKSDGASLQAVSVAPQPLIQTSRIFGYVRDKDTNAPIGGAHVLFIHGIFTASAISSSEPGFIGEYGAGSYFVHGNCIGMAWASGYLPTIVYVYIDPVHQNYVDFSLTHT